MRGPGGAPEAAPTAEPAGSVEGVLQQAAILARRGLQASTVSVMGWERSRGTLQAIVVDGEDLPRSRLSAARYVVADWPLAERLLRDGEPFVVSTTDPSSDAGLRYWLQRVGQGSGLGVPILLNGRVWGELLLTRSPDLPEFLPADIPAGLEVAARLSAAIAPVQHLAALSRLAYSDTLTDLENRRGVEEQLAAAVERHHGEGSVVSLVLLDVDGLGQINESLGRHEGDRVLLRVSTLVSTVAAGAAAGSVAGRIGGDRFCVLLEGYPADDAVRLAHRLTTESRDSLGVLLACGVASTGEGVGDVQTGARLLALASTALGTARRLGTSEPVVAGRELPTPDDGVPGEAEPPALAAADDHRAARRRAGRRPDWVLRDGLRAIDIAGPGQLPRLEAVADRVCRLVDGCGWWVSRTDDSGEQVLTAAYSTTRFAGGPVPPQLDGETTYLLRDYPLTVRMLTGASALITADDPDADPAELGILTDSGYTGMVMAGGRDRDGRGWLVEVFLDALSADPSQLPPVLRALTACALLPAD